MPEILQRPVDAESVARLVATGCDPRLARLYAARGVADPAELSTTFASLVPPDRLLNVDRAARLLADAIERRERLVIIADYDADGATACAVGLRALRSMGAIVDFFVPNRFEHGYGLTPEIVQAAAKLEPTLLITVDNGIAAVAGVEAANRLGMRVLVTDHHLPGSELPQAECIVNPNQPGCDFPSKHIAGVGVIFYVMLALRSELRRRGAFAGKAEPQLAELLDLVALGTVADVVRLDANNRILVTQGLARIRAGKASPGVRALFEAAGRSPRRATVYDLAFVAGPRLNAAGRLDDMSLGIECLSTENEDRAAELGARLDKLNHERREIEVGMVESALALLEGVDPGEGYSLSVHRPDWHGGVVGILASRLKDRFHRPVFAFAEDGTERLRGSGRSIPGLHLRDALDLVDKRNPGLLERFGGHSAAAGVTIPAGRFADFASAFEAVAREALTAADLERRIDVDGELGVKDLGGEFARLLRDAVWGQGFPEPRFVGTFEVASQRVVGERHLKLALKCGGRAYPAMRFGSADPLPGSVRAVYRLDLNEYLGEESLQLTLEHWEAATP